MDAPGWIGAGAGTVAAATGIALWRYNRRVRWEVEPSKRYEYRLVYQGPSAARRVWLTDKNDPHLLRDAGPWDRIEPGGSVAFVAISAYGLRPDLIVNWRTRWRARRRHLGALPPRRS